MKTLLRTSLAAGALVASTGAAQAQSWSTEYSNPVANIPLVGPALAELAYAGGIGTVYRQRGSASGNTGNISNNVSASFTLRGNVDKDCSFYTGTTNAREINLGTIGIRGGAGENVADAFNMVDDARAQIRSGTAGCNFKNTLTISKENLGLGMVNTGAAGFDSDEFQANLPYVINAEFFGTTNITAGAAGGPQRPQVGLNQPSATWTGGAWRSTFAMDITIPAPDKGLVAGTYSDKITVTLATI